MSLKTLGMKKENFKASVWEFIREWNEILIREWKGMKWN